MLVNIEGKEYDTEKMSAPAREQFQMIQFVEAEIARLAGQNAAMQTARNAYYKSLVEALQAQAALEAPAAMAGDTIKFS